MPKKASHKFDAAGWLFWTVVFLLLLVPCTLLVRRLEYMEDKWGYPVLFGLIGASVGAGVVSWAVNAVLQYRQKKERLKQRKARKKKRS